MNFNQVDNQKINISVNHISQNCGNVDIEDKVLILYDERIKFLDEKFQNEFKNCIKNVIKEEVYNLNRLCQRTPL